MAGLHITITDAGRAALPNGTNTGTSAVTISHVGVSAVHTAGSLKGLTALPGEVKRFMTFGGDIVADDVIHVTINDETTDVYSVRAFGLYLSTGVLFAVFSSPDVVVEKSAGAMVLLSADITFKTLDTAVIQFGGTGFINPPATTERMGVVELATWEEAAAGNRADVAVTPYGLLKTLQSWATNFAAAVHRHAMTAIDGLPEALASKSAVGHKHDASDTNSGVFEVGRIPALGMEKITGLSIALANRAALIHGHFMSDIDGLVQALAGKAAAAHTHVMGDISGLAEALAGKAAAAHAHVMGDVQGLAAALLLKADLAGAAFTGVVRVKGSETRGSVEISSSSSTYRPGLVTFHTPDGTRRGYLGYASSDEGGELLLQGETGWIWRFSTRPRFGPETPWDSANFNPALKADLASPALTGTPTAPTAAVGTNTTQLATTAFVQAGLGLKVSKTGDVMSGPLAMPELRLKAAGTGSGNTFAAVISKYYGDDSYGIGFVGWRGAAGGRTEVGSVDHLGRAWLNGYRVWTAETLNPASQAEAAAGVANDRFITPGALWSFARNLGSPGYAVIPGTGLMLQWGITVANIPEGETQAVLPVAFGGGCLIALANPRNPGRNVNSDFYMQVVGHFADRIAFFANRANDSAGNLDGFEWVALGRVSGGTPDPAYSSGGSGGIGGGGGQVEV